MPRPAQLHVGPAKPVFEEDITRLDDAVPRNGLISRFDHSGSAVSVFVVQQRLTAVCALRRGHFAQLSSDHRSTISRHRLTISYGMQCDDGIGEEIRADVGGRWSPSVPEYGAWDVAFGK